MRDLSRLLRPKSVALFGGSWAENVIIQLQKSGFKGDIWPVHPKRESMCGIPCLVDVSKLPAPPDASFVGVNRELTIEIVAALSGMGAGGAACFASGFLEAEGENAGSANLQKKLVEAAGDMPTLGPNCYGILNYLDNVTLWPDQHGGRPVGKGVALIGQSSNILINMTMQKRSLPVAYTIAVGNQAQTGLSTIASHLLEDERVSAIGLFIEGFGDFREFEAMAAKARQFGKPVVAIKSGKSEKSRIATMTHTASLAGGAAASSALLRRLGVVEVDSIAVFLETLKLLHAFGPLKGNAISSMSCSGGEAGLISDMTLGTQLDFRKFSPAQHTAIKEMLGPIVAVANPLDYHTFIWGDETKLKKCYASVLADGFDLNILINDIPPEDRCDPAAWECSLNAIEQATRETGSKVAMLGTLPENLSEELGDRLMASGIVPLHGMEEAVLAIDAAIRAGKSVSNAADPVLLVSAGIKREVVLDEVKAKTVLSKHGVPFPKSATANSRDDIARASAKLKFPLALKGTGIAHKSEQGAVALNLKSSREIEAAAQSMNGVTGYLIEEMVDGAIAEILVGITRDATGTFLLTIGAGGIQTELLEDTVCVLVPAARETVAEELASLKVYKLLTGYRGKPAADIDKLLDLIMAVQTCCIENCKTLMELDINPVIVQENGAVAVDALIKLGETCNDRTC